jgi:hypothetical protein
MTTGRINQVTIRHPGRTEGHPTARKGWIYRYHEAEERRSVPQPRGCRGQCPQPPSDRSNCPHWVSQRVVRRARFRARSLPPALHAPPEWRWPATAHAVLPAVHGRGQPPRILVQMLALANYPQIPGVPGAVETPGLPHPARPGEPPKQLLIIGKRPYLSEREWANPPLITTTAIEGNRRTKVTSYRCAAAVPPKGAHKKASDRASEEDTSAEAIGDPRATVITLELCIDTSPGEEFGLQPFCSSLIYPAAMFGCSATVAQRTYRKRFSGPRFC